MFKTIIVFTIALIGIVSESLSQNRNSFAKDRFCEAPNWIQIRNADIDSIGSRVGVNDVMVFVDIIHLDDGEILFDTLAFQRLEGPGPVLTDVLYPKSIFGYPYPGPKNSPY